jgi:hypothetical protein
MVSPTLEIELGQQELLKITGLDQLEIHEVQESVQNKPS